MSKATKRKRLTGDQVHWLRFFLTKMAESNEATAAETKARHPDHWFHESSAGCARGFRVALEEIERLQAEVTPTARNNSPSPQPSLEGVPS